ncbi:helix-turn-helix transcriptional regulator [Microbacterium hibisci]|uniref:helix-turn-helix transcriptional regulator n=1 Tax=Microbacterium hibisci TaxID=2036000 RepID=UPI001942D98F|nr:WYL domain-containing protein [Microbacterium hibisci]
MLETSARLLRLLALLHAHPDLSGPELARRLDVTTRTVRADVERLRALGYPVEATVGRIGGYRLGSGGDMPPLLLDDDDAIAVAVGLRLAGTSGVAGIDETSVRSLTKLEQVMPSRLRHRVDALHGAILALHGTPSPVSTEVLTAVATAIRARERLRFHLVAPDEPQERFDVEPHRLVSSEGRWHLLAWVPAVADWRLFPLEHLRPVIPTGPRFSPRGEPDGGVAAYVDRQLGRAHWRYRATLRAHVAADVLQRRIPSSILVEPVDESTCLVHVGSDDPHQLALWVTMLDAEIDVLDAPELRSALAALADRLARAASGPAHSDRSTR